MFLCSFIVHVADGAGAVGADFGSAGDDHPGYEVMAFLADVESELVSLMSTYCSN